MPADVERRLAPPIVHDLLARDGYPLDANIRGVMERRLGHDFSAVRIHCDERANESARALGADAYTVGQHIAFAAGKLSPETTEGRGLLAHELAHVVQQSSHHGPIPISLAISDRGSSSEKEAENMGEAEANRRPNEQRIANSNPVVLSKSPNDKKDRTPPPKAAAPAQDPAGSWSPKDFVLALEAYRGKESCFSLFDKHGLWRECDRPLPAYADEPIFFKLRYRIDWAGGPHYPGPKKPLQGFQAGVLFEFTNRDGRKKELFRATDSAPVYEEGGEVDTVLANLPPFRVEPPSLVAPISFTEGGKLRMLLRLHYDGPPVGEMVLDDIYEIDFIPGSPGTDTGIYLIVPDPTKAPLVYKRLTGKEGMQKPPAVVVTVWSDDRGYYYNSKAGKVRLPERP